MEISKESVLDQIGLHLRGLFDSYEKMRKTKEEDWLQSLRQYKGIYDPEVYALMDGKQSKVYPKITRARCVTVLSRLHDMLFPFEDKNWGIKPTPRSTIPEAGMRLVMQTLNEQRQMAMQQAAQNKQDPNSIPEISQGQVEEAIRQYAKMACEAMELEMDDQLVECQYERLIKLALESGVKYGTGLIKGPLVEKESYQEWTMTDTGWVLVPKEALNPYIEWIPVWDFYPDPSRIDFKEGLGCFQRHIMSRHDLRVLAKRDDFLSDTIVEYIKSNPDGNCTHKSWEQQLRLLQETSDYYKKNRYEVLEWWGQIEGQDLEKIGLNIPNVDAEMEIQAWVLGDKPIKIALNTMPEAIRPYYLFYFEKDETSIWGEGLPKVMRDSQIAISASARMCLDNAASVSGPQVEVNERLMSPDMQVDDFYPRKVWRREGQGMEAQYPAIRAIEFNSHIDEYIQIIKQFMDFGDLETALPIYMLIDPGANRETARGASYRHGTINIMVKDILRNFDDFNADIIKALYKWNMDFSKKEELKGDYKIIAKGSTSLLQKEVLTEALNMYSQSMRAEEVPYLKMDVYSREKAKALNLPMDMIRTEAEAQEYMQSMNDPRVVELQIQTMEANIKKLRASALGQLAAAKKKSVEADRSGSMFEKEVASMDNLTADSILKRASAVEKLSKARTYGKDLSKLKEKASGAKK
jgi:hypothetical protein